MITLKTLPQATEQEVFDQVVNHLRAQGEPSKDGVYCLYRHPTGLKCAAGCLITDEEYKPEMDTGSQAAWPGLIKRKLVPEDHSELIRDLQCVHDDSRVENWEEQFKIVAKDNNLIYTPRSC